MPEELLDGSSAKQVKVINEELSVKLSDKQFDKLIKKVYKSWTNQHTNGASTDSFVDVAAGTKSYFILSVVASFHGGNGGSNPSLKITLPDGNGLSFPINSVFSQNIQFVIPQGQTMRFLVDGHTGSSGATVSQIYVLGYEIN